MSDVLHHLFKRAPIFPRVKNCAQVALIEGDVLRVSDFVQVILSSAPLSGQADGHMAATVQNCLEEAAHHTDEDRLVVKDHKGDANLGQDESARNLCVCVCWMVGNLDHGSQQIT